MIKIYKNNEITPNEFIKKHVEENRPCVIKNFYSSDDKCFKYYDSNYVSMKIYKIGNINSGFLNENCLNNFMDNIKEFISFNTNVTRVWSHNKGNITRWHYDGNGQDVINICLHGKKRFYLAPPGSIPVYPLSNIALSIIDWDNEYADIEQYDLLYIPSYWFHKVITLENKTVTINHIFFHKNHNLYASQRDLYVYRLHDFFKTYMCTQEICKITKKQPLLNCFIYGFYELLWIYLLLFLLFIGLYRYNIKFYNIGQIILFIVSSYYYFDNNYDYIFSGINKLYGFYFFIFLILLNVMIKLIIPSYNLTK